MFHDINRPTGLRISTAVVMNFGRPSRAIKYPRHLLSLWLLAFVSLSSPVDWPRMGDSR